MLLKTQEHSAACLSITRLLCRACMAGAALLDDPELSGDLHETHHLSHLFAEPKMEDNDDGSCESGSDNSEHRSHQRPSKKASVGGRYRC